LIMDVWLLVILCLSMIWLAVQDFRSRMFYWILLPTIFISAFARGVLAISPKFWLSITLINGLLALVIVGTLVAYLHFMKRDSKLLTSFGLGDILLLGSITPLLLPIQFLLTVLLSSVLGLLGYLFLRHRGQSNRIPFAGWIGVVSVCFLIVDHFLL
jgi:hypothetical protein